VVAVEQDVASLAGVGALVEALASRLGPGFEVVIRRSESDVDGAVARAGDPVRLSCRRVVDLLGIPYRVGCRDVLVEAVYLMVRAGADRPKLTSICADANRAAGMHSSGNAGEKNIRYALTHAYRHDAANAAAILGAPYVTVGDAVRRLASLVVEDLAQGGGR
jgi:hypothetical protein